MNLVPVTDPQLLARLNAGSKSNNMASSPALPNQLSIKPGAKLVPVTDEKLLSKLNAPKESQDSFKPDFGYAAKTAGMDLLNAIAGQQEKIPHYISYLMENVPAAAKTLTTHPLHAMGQMAAGATELGHGILNFPHNLNEYTEKLKLSPPGSAQDIPYQKDISSEISQAFGEPKYQGEELIRGAVRNLPSVYGGGKALNVLNPLRYTEKNIVKGVLKEEKKQVASHTKQYNNIWKEADQSGYNSVPVDMNKLTQDFDFIKKYKTPREYGGLQKFMQNPTLENAQRAQSDMNAISRALEEKSRSGSLLSEETSLHSAAKSAEEHIESNMFKNAQGNVNKPLKDKYDTLTSSYRENVVPYKYNPDIQDYKSKDITRSQLVERLKKGPFAARKGYEHPELFRQDTMKKALGALGIGGSTAAGLTLFDLFRNK